MLDVIEIKNLEVRWKRYKRKKNIKIFILICIFCIIGGVLVYCIELLNKKNGIKNKNNIITTKKVIIKSHEKPEKISKPTKIIKHINDKNNTINKIKVIQTKIKKPQNYKNNIDTLHLDKNFLKQIYIEEDHKDNVPKTDNSSIKNNNTKIVKIEEKQKNKKTKIVISSKKINKLKYFKEQYKASGKVLYAILISKEYYKNKLYQKSLKWAMIANSIDSSNEESWIMFAKNKVKLHQKNDALNALQAYLKVNSSKKLQALLFDIKNGVFK